MANEVCQFINEAFLPADPDSTFYTEQWLSTKDLYQITCRRSSFLDGKSCNSFASWTDKRKLAFLTAEERRDDDDGRAIKRRLYVLSEQQQGTVPLGFSMNFHANIVSRDV